MAPNYKIGQVWINPKAWPKTVFTVVKIEDGVVYAHRTDSKDLIRFAIVGSTIDKGWTECSGDYNKNDWMAWRHSAPGDCVCGIPRSLCDYHR